MLQLSGARVLTMEWMEGCKLTDVAALRAMRIHPRDVALDALHAFAQMVFVDGFGVARLCLEGFFRIALCCPWNVHGFRLGA